MKKILLLMVFAVCTTICLSNFAYAETDNEYMIIRYENLTLPNDSKWALDNQGIANKIPGLSYLKMNGDNAASEATARVYIETPGDYTMWVYGSAINTNENRHPVISIDGVNDKASFFVSGAVYEWRKSEGPLDGADVWTLDEGWHTITFKQNGTWNPCNIGAVLLTNDLEMVVTIDNDDEIVNSYSDIVKPEATEKIIDTQYSSYESLSVSFGSADDESGIKEYSYYVNDEKIELDENGTYIIDGLKALDNVELKVEVFDRYGNCLTETEVYTSSPVKVEDFFVRNAIDGSIVEDLSTLKANDVISLNAKLTNRTSDPIVTGLCMALYNKDFGRMNVSDFKMTELSADAKNVSANVTITLPENFSVENAGGLSAMLWDENTFEPYINAIGLEGISGE